jgi:hypothetical protein
MNRRYAQVALRAAHRCEYCRAPEAVFNFPFEVEHIVPKSRGGGDEDDNLALACRACNLLKASRVSGIDSETQDEIRLFDPRQQQWDEHFRIEPGTGITAALTAVGRVTITLLEMNSESQVAARRQWMRLGLFP